MKGWSCCCWRYYTLWIKRELYLPVIYIREKITASKAIKEFGRNFTGKRLFRIHSSHLVNLNSYQKVFKAEADTLVYGGWCKNWVASGKEIFWVDFGELLRIAGKLYIGKLLLAILAMTGFGLLLNSSTENFCRPSSQWLLPDCCKPLSTETSVGDPSHDFASDCCSLIIQISIWHPRNDVSCLQPTLHGFGEKWHDYTMKLSGMKLFKQYLMLFGWSCGNRSNTI